jgi:hypothetical protein
VPVRKSDPNTDPVPADNGVLRGPKFRKVVVKRPSTNMFDGAMMSPVSPLTVAAGSSWLGLVFVKLRKGKDVDVYVESIDMMLAEERGVLGKAATRVSMVMLNELPRVSPGIVVVNE